MTLSISLLLVPARISVVEFWKACVKVANLRIDTFRNSKVVELFCDVGLCVWSVYVLAIHMHDFSAHVCDEEGFSTEPLRHVSQLPESNKRSAHHWALRLRLPLPRRVSGFRPKSLNLVA